MSSHQASRATLEEDASGRWQNDSVYGPHRTPENAQRESLSETAAYDTRLRLSSCRIHSTVRFQLAPVWSTNSKSLILND